jgi:hypothetical protein
VIAPTPDERAGMGWWNFLSEKRPGYGSRDTRDFEDCGLTLIDPWTMA